jgi:alkylation response protein AidB-like acyl-CoA dehydrogenase
MTIANDLALRDIRGLVRDVVGRIEPRHMSQEHAQAMLAQLTELGVLDIGGDPADGGLGLEGAAVVLGQLSRGWGSLAWAAFPRVLLGALAIGPSAGVIGLAASQLGAFARGARLTASGQVSGTLADVLNGASGELILVLGPEAVATVGPDAVIEVADGGQFEGFRYMRHDDVTAQGTGRPLAVPPEQAVTVARALTAAVAVGIAEASVVSARDYQRQRIQFGRPIAEFGEMRAMLADAAAQVYAAREAMLAAARLSPGTAGVAAAAASAFLRASAAAVRASEMAQHSHGGYGHMAEFAVHDLVRDARMVAVCGGQRPDVDEAVLTGIDLV